MDNSDIKRFGRYEIVAELGRGAMGVVYKARDPQIDRMVAVKTVSMWGQDREERNEFRMRFLNEAQAAGRLHHAGIVSIFDVGENPENQDPYIVLEYVSGESLNRILAREKKLPLSKALQLAEEIAEALDYAHGQGVVHRDIKPANILLTEEGHAKIADFGIAQLNLAHFTLPGRVMGTPAYMAPEQLMGEGVDGRSDLFSLGVILYAMVTGHSPFQGNSATTVCFKVANREPVAPSAFDLNLPPELDEVISKAMAKDPGQRYQTGAAFAVDLRRLQEIFETGQTTSSLTAVIATGALTTSTRSRLTGQLIAQTGVVTPVGGAVQLIRTANQRPSLRNAFIGAGVLILVLFAGVQTRLLLISPHLGMSALNPASSNPIPPTESTTPGSGTRASTKTSSAMQPSHVMAPPRRPKLRAAHHRVPPQVMASSERALPFSERAISPSEAGVPSSSIELAVQHQFKDATLQVYVDNKLALTRSLHGGTQKRMMVFNGIRGVDSETLRLPAGKHLLRVRTLSSDAAIDLSKTISGEFVAGADKILHVTFGHHNTLMYLNWQ